MRGLGKSPECLAARAIAGFPPVAENGIKVALTTGMTTDRNIFDFPLRRGIMAEIEYPGVVQLIERVVWECRGGIRDGARRNAAKPCDTCVCRICVLGQIGRKTRFDHMNDHRHKKLSTA